MGDFIMEILPNYSPMRVHNPLVGSLEKACIIISRKNISTSVLHLYETLTCVERGT